MDTTVPPPAWITDNAIKITNIKGYDHDYLVHMLKVMNLNRLSSETAQSLITGELIKKQQGPLLPIEEQREIVAYLNDRLQKLDSFVEKITNSIKVLEEYRKALISHAVTGKIDVREEANAH